MYTDNKILTFKIYFITAKRQISIEEIRSVAHVTLLSFLIAINFRICTLLFSICKLCQILFFNLIQKTSAFHIILLLQFLLHNSFS